MKAKCARMEVDERYKVTSGEARTCPAANNQAQYQKIFKDKNFFLAKENCYII